MSESGQQGDTSRKADCSACRLIGAGGCFAGAWYALFERARLPANNRNRRWLGAIAIGESGIPKWVMVVMGVSIICAYVAIIIQLSCFFLVQLQ